MGPAYKERLKARRDVFAFQQVGIRVEKVRQTNHKLSAQEEVVEVVPRNDTAIFDSIASLMKALDHEMDQLPERAGRKRRLYVFNLLTVVDAPMVEVRYDGEAVTPVKIDRITHLCRYMVKRRDRVALIHFVNFEKLQSCIRELTEVAACNAKEMIAMVDRAYESIKTNSKVREHFVQAIKSEISWIVERSLRQAGIFTEPVQMLSLDYKNDELLIGVDVYKDDQTDALNNDDEAKDRTKTVLDKRLRYRGEFKFEWDIPF